MKMKITEPVLITCIILYLLCFSIPGISFEKPTDKILWHISALKATYHQKEDLYIAKGDVVITGGNTKLEADYAKFSNATKDILASGHVLLVSGSDTITCDKLRLNLATKLGTIYKGTVFIHENHFYLKGNKIEKTGKATYKSDTASITSCSGTNPDWKITGDNVKVTIEGYGYASNVTLWAKKVPVLYTPFFIFPGKTKRQTGLLVPKISFSDRKGFEYEQPLFFAISRNTDATLYTDYMAKRGLKLGLEYRYILNNGSKGAFFYDILHDRKTDDGTLATSDYSFKSTPKRTNRDRYWLRMKNDQKLGDNWKAKLDIDVVSDADYLHEFKDGFTGFNSTKKYFDHHFGRSIDDYDDTTRKNSLNINKTWANNSLNLTCNWYDNVIARRLNQKDTTLQTLPSIEFYRAKQKTGKTAIYFDLASQYKDFYRKDTDTLLINGQRADFHPRISMPLMIKNYLSVEPSAGVRETIWYANDFRKSSGEKDSFSHREIYDLDLKASTELSKIFNTNNGFAEKIKHEFIPKIEYLYIPNVRQNNLPYFDSIDRIKKNNSITWTLINRLTSKQKIPISVSDKNNDAKEKTTSSLLRFSQNKNLNLKHAKTSAYSYREFAWVKIYQSFDINRKEDGKYRPFSDIAADCEFSPSDYISLNADAAWSPYDNEFTSGNTGLNLKDSRGDILYSEYRYSRSVRQSFYTRLDMVLIPGLNAWISYEKNIRDNKRIETTAGFILHKKCWALKISFDDKPDNRSFAFMIVLSGIGGFGTK